MVQRRNFLRALIVVAASPLLGERVAHGNAWRIPLQATGSDLVIRNLRFTLTIENTVAQTLHNARIWLYMPVKHGARQTLGALNVSMPHNVIEDALGNTIVELVWDSFAAYATRIVKLNAQVRIFSEPLAQALLSPGLFLADEPFIEVNAPGVQALAKELQRQEALATAHAIYDWLVSHLHYAGFIADDLGANYALKNRRGDCTEYAYLAVALARANGIPARVLGGYVANRDAAPRSADYHNWAELYIDGAWRLLDAQKENFLTREQQYVAFRIVSSQVENVLGTAHRFKASENLVANMG